MNIKKTSLIQIYYIEMTWTKEYYEKNKDMLRIKANLNYLKRKNRIILLEEFTPDENYDT